jgi:hypothetical protein
MRKLGLSHSNKVHRTEHLVQVALELVKGQQALVEQVTELRLLHLEVALPVPALQQEVVRVLSRMRSHLVRSQHLPSPV